MEVLEEEEEELGKPDPAPMIRLLLYIAVAEMVPFLFFRSLLLPTLS